MKDNKFQILRIQLNLNPNIHAWRNKSGTLTSEKGNNGLKWENTKLSDT